MAAAEILLRCRGLRAVRAHHAPARVLPDARRAGAARGACAGDRRRGAPGGDRGARRGCAHQGAAPARRAEWPRPARALRADRRRCGDARRYRPHAARRRRRRGPRGCRRLRAPPRSRAACGRTPARRVPRLHARQSRRRRARVDSLGHRRRVRPRSRRACARGGRVAARGMTATPRTLYVHDDLSELTDDPDAARLAGRLLDLIRRDARVRVLTLAAQLEAVVAQGPHAPFALTVGIATAGERVARALHARTGWFPTIRRIEVARAENVAGGYDLATGGAGTLAAQLA